MRSTSHCQHLTLPCSLAKCSAAPSHLPHYPRRTHHHWRDNARYICTLYSATFISHPIPPAITRHPSQPHKPHPTDQLVHPLCVPYTHCHFLRHRHPRRLIHTVPHGNLSSSKHYGLYSLPPPFTLHTFPRRSVAHNFFPPLSP